MMCLDPLVQKTKHQNTQDITLLLDAQEGLHDLSRMPQSEILIRWVNYQLKKYAQHFQIAEDKFGLEIDERKFSQSRSQLNTGPIKTLQ